MTQLQILPGHQRRLLTLGVLALLLIVLASMSVTHGDASANQVQCGDTLIADTTLDNDLNCSKNGLIIGENAIIITLDCNGHTIAGAGAGAGHIGIHLAGSAEVTVKNCHVEGFDYGVALSIPGDRAPNYNSLQGNVAKNNIIGFLLAGGAFSNTLTGNKANDNGIGFLVDDRSTYNTLEGNIANNNDIGFQQFQSSYNTLTENKANANHRFGFYVFQDSEQNILRANTANDNGEIGFFVQAASSNILVGNTANGNARGFILNRATSNRLEENKANGNSVAGFGLEFESHKNLLVGNTANGNILVDAYQELDSLNNTFVDNDFGTTEGI